MSSQSRTETMNKKAFFAAADAGNLSKIKLLSSPKFFDLINAKEAENGYSLLHVAALAEHKNVVEFLIKQGANIFNRSNDDLTASESVQEEEGNENRIFKYLRKKELELLHAAILSDNPDKLSGLIKNGADLDVCDADDESIAHFAARKGRIEALKIMTKKLGKDAVYHDKQNTNGETPFDVLSYRGRYYVYSNGQYSRARNSKGNAKRPNNQSSPSTLIKIVSRMRRLAVEDPDKKFNPKQITLMQRVELRDGRKVNLSGLKIDIAHNIAIGPIMDSIVARMNNPLPEEDITANEFVEEVISSDDNAAKKQIKDFFEEIRFDDLLPHEKIQVADEVTERINRASPNLGAGHRSPNRGLGDNRDPHAMVSKEDGTLIEHKKSQKIAVRARRFLSITDPPTYRPLIRFNAEGDKEAKSSSVHERSDRAWFEYESPKSDILTPTGYFADTDTDSTSSEDEEDVKPKSPSRFKGSTFGGSRALLSKQVKEESDEESEVESEVSTASTNSPQ